MMYAVLSLGLAPLDGIVRLAQSATVVCAVTVRYTGHHQYSAREYLAHTALADGIFLVLVGLAALSWVVTLIRAVRRRFW